MKTPQQFVEAYHSKAIDFDGGYGVQCVDGWKTFCQWIGVPVKPTPNNWADGYWLYRKDLGYSQWFDFITDKSKIRTGDWCIWAKGSSCVNSHIAMYWEKVNENKSSYFGERQDGNLFFCFATIPDDWMGALRWKGFDMIGSWERVVDQFAGVEIIATGMPDGDSLTVISTNTPKVIQDIDDPDHVYDQKLNGGFFDNNSNSLTYGEAYGIRCGVDCWEVPRQGKFIYYALLPDGTTEVGNDSDFWHTEHTCSCALSPAMVLMHNGEDVEFVSPEVSWRRTYACSQSMLVRTAERFVFAISKGNLTPDQCRAWAKSIGALDLVFNDAGGSSCLQYGYDIYSGTGEHRRIANAWAFYHQKPSVLPVAETAAEEPIEGITNETPIEVMPIEVAHEVDDMENDEKKTVSGQLAKLIDVKSIITIMVMFCMCYLVMHGAEIPKDFMTVLIAIITFYFGYQSNKGEK